ncbi:hypothetical protein [Rhizobium alvei]|uniref:Uncharacterized protein n=1 Tax=Rhizobium alvei TaxID=1132659 RepID=A0ABT8YL20_9HYPH|nr:hypothetical protein [Rhizobium alvei]MDO6964423.1 hypothetical protein [Rhizobium alvei]
MGADEAMLEAQSAPTTNETRAPAKSRVVIRRLIGYLLAVAVGYAIFVFMWRVWPGNPLEPHQTSYILSELSVPYQLLSDYLTAAIFGIPYTVLGIVAVKQLWPHSRLAFLVTGMFCPAVSLVLFFGWNGLTTFIDDAAGLFLLTPPAGLAAAYIFGAIGMGYGFGRWRLG